jgi:hypothetical protein
MRNPEFTFPSRQLYIEQQKHHVRNSAIREGMFYTAMSSLEATYSNHQSVAFPVRLESIPDFGSADRVNSMAPIPMRMILLDADFQPSRVMPTRGTIENGVWEVEKPFRIEAGTKPVDTGYLLLSLPDEFQVNRLNSYGTRDPRGL